MIEDPAGKYLWEALEEISSCDSAASSLSCSPDVGVTIVNLDTVETVKTVVKDTFFLLQRIGKY